MKKIFPVVVGVMVAVSVLVGNQRSLPIVIEPEIEPAIPVTVTPQIDPAPKPDIMPSPPKNCPVRRP